MIAVIDSIVLYLPIAIDVAAYLIAGASLIAAATPWPTDDKWTFRAMEIVRYLALNVNHAIPIDRSVAELHQQMKARLDQREAAAKIKNSDEDGWQK